MSRPADLEVRQCEEADLRAVGAHLGQAQFHARRFQRQQAGESTYLIAWLGGVPVGHANVIWTEDEELRDFVRDCPELNALGVWPPEQRSHGVGTALILEAERLVRSRGYTRAGLAVGVDNPRAAALYERLGYRDSGRGTFLDRWTYTDPDGVEHEESELCIWLVKDLGTRRT